VASGIYADSLYLDVLNVNGLPAAQGLISLRLPLESAWADLEEVRLGADSIEATILVNRRTGDVKWESYGRVSISARLTANALPPTSPCLR
jgi:hypothetical protein